MDGADTRQRSMIQIEDSFIMFRIMFYTIMDKLCSKEKSNEISDSRVVVVISLYIYISIADGPQRST